MTAPSRQRAARCGACAGPPRPRPATPRPLQAAHLSLNRANTRRSAGRGVAAGSEGEGAGGASAPVGAAAPRRRLPAELAMPRCGRSWHGFSFGAACREWRPCARRGGRDRSWRAAGALEGAGGASVSPARARACPRAGRGVLADWAGRRAAAEFGARGGAQASAVRVLCARGAPCQLPSCCACPLQPKARSWFDAYTQLLHTPAQRTLNTSHRTRQRG